MENEEISFMKLTGIHTIHTFIRTHIYNSLNYLIVKQQRLAILKAYWRCNFIIAWLVINADAIPFLISHIIVCASLNVERVRNVAS